MIVVLGVCGTGLYFMALDRGPGSGNSSDATASPSPTIVRRDISSQEKDPVPLTEQEVFPQAEITSTVPGQAYPILKTQADIDCHVTARDDLGTTLVQLGCSQVVRATLRSPDEQYLITAGLFNLKDTASAEQAQAEVTKAITNNAGRMVGLSAGPGTEAMTTAASQLTMDVRGHFLAFCIVVRSDSETVAVDNPNAVQIKEDILVAYLRNTVIAAREIEVTPDGSGSTPADGVPPSG